MCGIAGIWNLNGTEPDKNDLVSFTETLNHRGPDGDGYYIDKEAGLGLGHKRLSILDLSENGRQPMSFSDERYWITYNGELFNFIELREELISKGYSFKSESDTEVILAAYHVWGKDCLLKFNGMWAFAIWDKKERKIFLARDHFGIKPLFFTHIPGKQFAFASEAVAFKKLKGFQREADASNVSRVLNDPFSLEGIGHTIYKNIYQLLPGHYLSFQKNDTLQQKRWWNTLDHLVDVPASYDQQVEQFRSLFRDACKIRLRSDVPVATALSGGVDSSAVYCMLHHLMKEDKGKERMAKDWQKAFVACFPGASNDERAFAEEVIASTKGSAVFIQPAQDKLIERIVDSTQRFDDIYSTPLSVVTDIYGAMRNKGIKVSMDGHGVDEMLFGYPHTLIKAFRLSEKQSNGISNEILEIYLSLLPPDKRENAKAELLNAPSAPDRSLLQSAYDIFFPAALKTIYRKVAAKPISEKSPDWLAVKSLGDLPNLSDRPLPGSELNGIDALLYNEFHVTTLPAILRNFDRASMQSSVEIRMPFMDHRLVSYVFSLPLQSRIGDGFTKRILRDSMKGLMPENIRTRKAKIGLNAPMPEWFSGTMKEYISDEIGSQNFVNSGIWNADVITKFVREKNKNNSWSWNDCHRFWLVLNAHILLNSN